jgi:predicted RNA-binding Zn ribbon-like protein
MVDQKLAAAAALREAIDKLGRARLACDLANEIAVPALKQLGTAVDAIGTAATLLQEAVRTIATQTQEIPHAG